MIFLKRNLPNICFLNVFFILCSMSHVFATDRQENREELTENVYRIINTAYSFNLPGYVRSLEDKDRYEQSKEIEVNKFTHAFSFIRKENGYLIKNLRDDNYLYLSDGKVDYKKLDREPLKKFLWDVNHIDTSIYTISPLRRKGFLVINKIVDKGDKGQRPSRYELGIDTEEKIERNILGDSYFDTPTSEWRINPFYPSSGYSDFFKIIKDCGDLIALKHGAKLKAIKTAPISSHDLSCLSVQCLDKTRICLNTHSPYYKPSIREIFSIEDVFKSNPEIQSLESVVKVTRVIETEEVFQTTIENSLTTLRRESRTTKEKNIIRQTQEEGEDLEKMDQMGFSQSLNTLLTIAVTQATDVSNTIGSRQSETLGESLQKSTYEDTGTSSSTGTLHDTGNSTSTGILESKSSGHDVSVSAGVKAGPVSAKASYGYHTNQTNQNNSNATRNESNQTSFNVTSTGNSGKSQTSEQNRQQTKEKYAEQTMSTSHAHQTENQTGEIKEERKDQTTTLGQRTVLTNENIREQEQLRELGVEQSLNLTEIKSSTQKKNEKWFIEREFHHIPNTALQIKFYEEAEEAIDYPFEVSLRISGHVGFTFDRNFLIGYDPRRDYLTGSTWYLSPSTILKYLKAPGYKPNQDGSVNYIVRGKLNLKLPLNIFTVIHQDILPIKHQGSKETINTHPTIDNKKRNIENLGEKSNVKKQKKISIKEI